MGFDVTSQAYDRFMGEWSRQLSVPMADLAGVVAGARVLDVGAGPGALTEELASRVGIDRVAAVDPSGSFVAALQGRWPDLDVQQAGAESLPFDDDVFDVALAQLVVHFMADPPGGIREMARVVRPGGRVAACVWDYGGDRSPLTPFWATVREGGGDVDDESRRAGARDGDLVRLLAEAGLTGVAGTELAAEREYGDFEAWWEPYTLGVGPAGSYVASLGEAERADLRERCRARLGADGPFTLTAHAWAAVGTVA